MTDQFVFNAETRPVYDQSINTYQSPGIMAPQETDAGKLGKLFMATATNSQSLGLGGGSVVITMQAANPSGSGVTMYISRIYGGTGISLSLLSSFTASATMIKGGTLSSPATITSVNSNFGSTNTSAMTLRSSTASPSGGTSFAVFPLSPGPFANDYSGSIVVPPNQTITMTVSAALSIVGVLSTNINMEWWEA